MGANRLPGAEAVRQKINAKFAGLIDNIGQPHVHAAAPLLVAPIPPDPSGSLQGPAIVSIYLPIAELPVNLLLILGLGVAVGFISGMFGIGGGFLMTPLLILVGIPPAVAVANVPTHMAASSMSGALTYWRRKMVDFGLGLVLLSGGLLGTAIGVWVFSILLRFGQLDLFVGLSYVILLGIVSLFADMTYEGGASINGQFLGSLGAAPRR